MRVLQGFILTFNRTSEVPYIKLKCQTVLQILIFTDLNGGRWNRSLSESHNPTWIQVHSEQVPRSQPGLSVGCRAKQGKVRKGSMCHSRLQELSAPQLWHWRWGRGHFFHAWVRAQLPSWVSLSHDWQYLGVLLTWLKIGSLETSWETWLCRSLSLSSAEQEAQGHFC